MPPELSRSRRQEPHCLRYTNSLTHSFAHSSVHPELTEHLDWSECGGPTLLVTVPARKLPSLPAFLTRQGPGPGKRNS